MKNSSRRTFMKTGAAGSALLAASPAVLNAAPAEKTDVWIFEGADNRALMEACMKTIFENGGFGPNAKKVALKVNAAWDRTPEQAANTHPELVDVFLEKSIESGVKVVMPENPCHRPEKSFVTSGLQATAEKHGVEMVDLKGKRNKDEFVEVDIPNGAELKTEKVARDFLDADAVVNMPIAKHHGGAKLSICMKNWMGAVEGRKLWHVKGLHQCIADFSTFMKPTWAIVDATCCMTSKGPQGPSEDMIHPQQVILSKDQVAADTVTALLFHDDPLAEVNYLQIAHDMGIGETDVNNMNIHRIKV
ncbi:DUF362 domain-containing protein [Tichowtungia aerotolerans]|uniref:DUF362 domain-containing protein n=1 Tax=Tichowtungia aerotolerans TaxID=2697043 RepID=A0A6P1M7Z2_9BACT|nr:DUF362 domain-containing protein [Tichowtungia aerotolerans]QHI69997.1 DUF362 domain-containing protein [Tichowtungia aerotolerans]